MFSDNLLKEMGTWKYIRGTDVCFETLDGPDFQFCVSISYRSVKITKKFSYLPKDSINTILDEMLGHAKRAWKLGQRNTTQKFYA